MYYALISAPRAGELYLSSGSKEFPLRHSNTRRYTVRRVCRLAHPCQQIRNQSYHGKQILHLCSATTTFSPLNMVFSQASTSKALPSTNGDHGFLDPSQALKHLSTYTSKDGLSLQELNDGRAGGITYNDFLCLVSTQLPTLTHFKCRIFSAWPYQFHC
jgi:hypothetical protein